MKLLRNAVLVAIFLVGVFTVTAYSVSGSGTLDTGQIATGRIFRNGVQSTCANNKPFPGWYSTYSHFAYSVEGPFLATESGCVTVNWSTTSCAASFNIHPSAYSGSSFNSTYRNNAPNYLGDPGSSNNYSFTFNIAAGEEFILVFENNFSIEACDYSYSVIIPGDAPSDGNASSVVERFAFSDGRINKYDTGTPVVLYGKNDGDDNWSLDIYAADGGGLLLSVPASIVNANPRCPDNNKTIISDESTGIILSHLTQRPDGTCPFQLNAPTGEPGKSYVIIFDELFPHSYYESYEFFSG